MEKNNRVLLGMSGGTDSSVAALLLQEAGYEVTGITFRFYELNGSTEYLEDARALADRLGIEHLIYDARRLFQSTIIDYFVSEYLHGRTPVPCTLCNNYLKWPLLKQVADERSIYHLATGHYVNKRLIGDHYHITCGRDRDKDQSFFLWGLPQEILRRMLLPMGDTTKVEVRQLAAERGFHKVAGKKDSLGVCFCPMDYRGFLRKVVAETSSLRPSSEVASMLPPTDSIPNDTPDNQATRVSSSEVISMLPPTDSIPDDTSNNQGMRVSFSEVVSMLPPTDSILDDTLDNQATQVSSSEPISSSLALQVPLSTRQSFPSMLSPFSFTTQTPVSSLSEDLELSQEEKGGKWHPVITPGYFYDETGTVVGRHEGFPFYTIGQRRGLGLQHLNRVVFVKDIIPEENKVVVAPLSALEKSEMVLKDWNVTNPALLFGQNDIIVKIRYRKQANHCTVTLTPDNLLHVQLHEPLTSVAPGQAAAFYKEDIVLGGGIIVSAR